MLPEEADMGSSRRSAAAGRTPYLLAAAALTAGLVQGCGGDDVDSTSASGSTSASSTSAARLPEAEDVATLGALTIPARPFPDFMLAVDQTVWVSGVEPGIVGYDATTGDVRAQVATQEVPLAMEQGFGAVWAGEGTGDLFATLVRIDTASGTATARIPLPEPGLRPESSLAVTDDAVWALVDGDTADDRLLVAVDPATNTVRDTFPAPRAAEALRGGFGSLWVATSQQSVVRVDPTDGSTEATVETGFGSRFMAVGDDALWVMNQDDGTVSRIDPETDAVVAAVQASEGRIPGGDIAFGDGAVWVRTESELATALDPETDEVTRVLGPAAGSGSIAVTDGAVWLTAHDDFVIQRVPTG
jgi:virginiamycin B lyase